MTEGPTPLFSVDDHRALCFVDDRAGIRLRDAIGVDRTTFESDYPHTVTSWPSSREKLARGLEGCTPEEVESISYENAGRLVKHTIPETVTERVRTALATH